MGQPTTISGLTWWNQYSNPSFLNLSGNNILSVIDGINATTYFQTAPSPDQVQFQNNIYSSTTINTSGGTRNVNNSKMSSLNGQYSGTSDFTIFSRYIFTGTGIDDVICSSDAGGGFANGELYDGSIVPYRWFQNKIFAGNVEFNVWADPNTASGFLNFNVPLTANTWINQAFRVYQDGATYRTELWINDVLINSASTTYTAVAPVLNPGIIVASLFAGSIAEQFWFNKKLDSAELTDMFVYLTNKYDAPPPPPSPTPTPTPTPLPFYEPNFKTIADDLEQLSFYHKQINSFGLGDTDQLSYWTQMRDKDPNDTFESPVFPLMYVVPGSVTNGLRFK